MVNWSLLTVFVPTFFFVSITPGMCMTLALTLGMTVGLRRTLWMMAGELLGVAVVVTATMAGIAAIMLQFPWLFWLLKIGGGLYLFYLGIELWRSRGRMAICESGQRSRHVAGAQLAMQGFVTAIANPKGWAFFIALLPPFISQDLPLVGQWLVWLTVILFLELVCLLIYAKGGESLGNLLADPTHVKTLNRIAGSLMISVAVWLVIG